VMFRSKRPCNISFSELAICMPDLNTYRIYTEHIFVSPMRLEAREIALKNHKSFEDKIE